MVPVTASDRFAIDDNASPWLQHTARSGSGSARAHLARGKKLRLRKSAGVREARDWLVPERFALPKASHTYRDMSEPAFPAGFLLYGSGSRLSPEQARTSPRAGKRATRSSAPASAQHKMR